jgi:glycosyltransferase involved in cell wall biosynthesis
VIDKNALTKLVPDGKEPAPISVLPNGVDLDYFTPNDAIQRDPETIVFSGKMSYHANISMVKYLVGEVMPRVWESRPEVLLVIVGKDPPSDVKSMASDPRITVTGTVKDIRPYLWQATVAVVPLVYGAGIQNKILEAMATGTPVVTTSKAISALQTSTGRDIVVADTPIDFSNEILRLITDERFRVEIAKMGLQYVQKHHDWAGIARQLVNEYHELTSHKASLIS